MRDASIPIESNQQAHLSAVCADVILYTEHATFSISASRLQYPLFKGGNLSSVTKN